MRCDSNTNLSLTPFRTLLGNNYCTYHEHHRKSSTVITACSTRFLKLFRLAALIDLSESDTDEKKKIDVYAIGFEEMVDLDAKNIMNAR